MRKLKEKAVQIPFTDSQIREAIHLIKMAIQKQEQLMTEFMADNIIVTNIQIQSYLRKVINDLSQKLNDCIIALKLAEHQVFSTKYTLSSMLDTFMCFEDKPDYEEEIF